MHNSSHPVHTCTHVMYVVFRFANKVQNKQQEQAWQHHWTKYRRCRSFFVPRNFLKAFIMTCIRTVHIGDILSRAASVFAGRILLVRLKHIITTVHIFNLAARLLGWVASIVPLSAACRISIARLAHILAFLAVLYGF